MKISSGQRIHRQSAGNERWMYDGEDATVERRLDGYMVGYRDYVMASLDSTSPLDQRMYLLGSALERVWQGERREINGRLVARR